MRCLTVRTWVAAALIQLAAWVLGCEVVTDRKKTARSREEAEVLCR